MYIDIDFGLPVGFVVDSLGATVGAVAAFLIGRTMDNKPIEAAIMGAATTVMALGLVVLKDGRSQSYIPRAPHINRKFERETYMNSVIYDDAECIKILRMRSNPFFGLCEILAVKNLLRETIHMPIKEQMFIFLHVIGHNVRFRVVGGRLYRSCETVHRYFRVVLKAVLLLYKHVVKLPDNETLPEIMNNRRFYPYFKDCVGAIDGTHVRASVPLEFQGKFRGRKGETSQNVLAAISFDLHFTYVLAGWEGSAHDSRILDHALSRPRGFKVPEGKYYLGDAGYGIRRGIISPYRGTRYHLKEFGNHPPQNKRELFNLRHSSLRSTVERCFGVLKKRFRVIDAEPFWSFKTQVDVVLACCIIHNYVKGVDPMDGIMEEVNDEMARNPNPRVQQTQREVQEENREWVSKRDEISDAMWQIMLLGGIDSFFC